MDYGILLNYMMRSIDNKHSKKISSLISNFNIMNIAETTYNTDRCFSYIIKFYRPSILHSKKKATINLLKKGKINFEGSNSQEEAEELYYWIQYIYNKHSDRILHDITKITNVYNSDTSSCDDDESIYEDSELD